MRQNGKVVFFCGGNLEDRKVAQTATNVSTVLFYYCAYYIPTLQVEQQDWELD